MAHSTTEGTDWRLSNITLQQRFAYVFNNKNYCDVSFIVGKEQERKIVANKIVLAVGSQVFHSMFQDSFGTISIIEVPDIEPAVFYELIRFLYSDEALVSAETALPLLNAAKTYAIPGLESRCIDFLTESLSPNNAFALLSQATKLSAIKLFNACLDKIDENTVDAVSADDFCNIDVETLCSILCRDTLRIREVDLFEAVLRWSKAECSRRNLLSTIENQRLVLETPILLIRFPLMTSAEFSMKVACLSLLPEKDTISLFMYFNGISEPTLSFSRKLRRGLCDLVPAKSTDSSIILPADSEYLSSSQSEEFIVKRFAETSNKWVYLGNADEIAFYFDHDVKLKGIGLYSAKSPMIHYRATIEIFFLKSKKDVCEPLKIKSVTGSKEIYKVAFKNSIDLIAFIKYVIRVKISGPPSLYGTGGLKKVSVDLTNGKTITTTFIDVEDKYTSHRTGVQSGQIPVLFLEA